MKIGINIALAGLALFAAGCSNSTNPSTTAGNVPAANSNRTTANTTRPAATPALPSQQSGLIPFPDSPRIPLDQAKADFDRGAAVFIDTHSAQVYAAEHIVGSINISNNELDAKAQMLPKNKKIIVYCS
jgi:Rhodanese-related sulfurtransferase